MFLRKKCRYGSRKLQFLLLLLMLGFLLLMVTMLTPPPSTQSKDGTFQPVEFSPREGYQMDFAEPQEMLETPEESQQYYPLDGLSPFISLREDELIAAVVSPAGRRNHSKARKGYRVVRQQGRRPGGKAEGDPEPQLLSLPLQPGDGAAAGGHPPGLDTHGFDEALSERISLRRELPEVRHPLCLQQEYDSSLPTASVIICFHDEAWSTLLRTVHSIMDTAPKASLKDIILVDDLSQQGPLKSALSEYISKLDGVKLIRSNKRLGVIRGRMLGAARATGDVLIFMDSHCECQKGWLEPLLARLSSNRNSVVSPVIDVIDWKTFQYYHSVGLHRGVFDWKLNFHWEPVPEHEEKVRQSPISPIRSPVVAGAVVAMDRHYFQNTGAYDSDMTIWGAENLELSIRTWLCGGTVEIIPCSRVGHVYRNHFPDAFSYEEAIVRNKIRIAETWLGSFKENFYKQDTVAFLISKAEKPDCSERLQLQKRLGCRNFQWFVSNVYPELSQPEDAPSFSGKLYNTGVGFCADYRPGRAIAEGSIELSPCSDSLTQHFEYNSMKEIRLGSAPLFCFDVRHGKVIPQNCTKETDNRQQHWDVQENGMIVHVLSGKCIEAAKSDDEKDLVLCACNENANQVWQFERSHVLRQR
ncbi:polypeptide N-acetylgalactosaminyltransferase 15 isoform X1 [Falco biarmicus]|uniref:polypeptide N-acetylgalactosaminyltransferase 15 isoform X1 n=1 Tax=Falco peregrinus TaxID=8954 RepID=UPI0018869A33|nr:polypeptide N-acetylgalactosaminyltransferase 15 isoform X1 [Falco peregrinus]XP_027638565.2 polypeptide N-acetylgalactosaminyltransferase 15 isoform X1 [Falco peregrinus]XP_037240754.1 polypeptide N-acetylgalactosaminyltransferase 15 isoform X1 [Falco rusticolus]XP_037240755.1 polypeptide N-acetylgalactosaminyltransferase 15 isoform X1 [Falco rusticolus]XP_055564710.1 polypeptide N-acetylgalactosaminyltransferase 15 isoform X1 [Falco cherrug]XP_055564712.1 polypeptide N-acetylgalactosaminy